MTKTILSAGGLLAMLTTLYVTIYSKGDGTLSWNLIDALTTMDSILFKPIALFGFVPAIFTVLISIVPKKIPVISSKWFNVLVCTSALLSMGILGFVFGFEFTQDSLTQVSESNKFDKEAGYYLWMTGATLTFIAAFFSNRISTGT